MKKIYLTLIMILFLSSCASIIRDSSQTIPVNSNIDKVDIEIKNKQGMIVFKGQTPTYINLKPSTDGGYFSPEKYTITASKDGYQTEIRTIDYHVSKWYILGNIGFGGLIGYLIVDPITGKMYYLDENVYLNMSKL